MSIHTVDMYRKMACCKVLKYRVIKKSLGTWWLEYRKLQVRFEVSPANCVLQERVQYSTLHIPNEMGWACGAYGWGEGVNRVLLGKPEGRIPLGRPRRRWVDNIRMDLQEVGCGYMEWIGLAQDRESWRTLVSAVINLRVAWNAGNFLTSCKPVSFSRRTLHHGVDNYIILHVSDTSIVHHQESQNCINSNMYLSCWRCAREVRMEPCICKSTGCW